MQEALIAGGSKRSVLIVEDESDVRDLVALHLKRADYQVTAVGSAEEAKGALAAKGFDVLVLDWMLPGVSGVELARHVKSDGSAATEPAVLMLTAKSEPRDIVQGLDAGADDYLTKPFEPSVLVARVRALTRRLRASEGEAKSAKTSTAESPIVRLGGLTLDTVTYEVKCGDTPISFTPSEFKLVVALAKHKGRVLTRDALIAQVQGEGVSVVGRTIDTHVFGLRKKLGACADVIETVRGIGYRVKPDT